MCGRKLTIKDISNEAIEDISNEVSFIIDNRSLVLYEAVQVSPKRVMGRWRTPIS